MTEFLRRRIKWRANQCTAELAGDVFVDFSWIHRCFFYDDGLKEMVPYETPKWHLHADGLPEGEFEDEVQLKLYIIRFVYDIQVWMLIPSELLYDAGLLYVTNEWIDTWNQPGQILIEAREDLPAKPAVRSIRLPDKPGQLLDLRKPRKEKVKDEHRTSLRVVPKQSRRQAPQIKRLGKGDDLDLTWEEEYDVWLADQFGAGTDEYDTLNDDECYYVLETGVCNAETCAIVTIEAETPPGEEGDSQVQNAGEAEAAQAANFDQDDYYRFG